MTKTDFVPASGWKPLLLGSSGWKPLLLVALVAALAAFAAGCGGEGEAVGAGGKSPAAAKPAETAAGLADEAAAAFAQAKGPEALDLVRRARALKPESAELALFEGEAMYLAGEEDAAVARFTEIADDTKLASAIRSQALTDRAIARMERPGVQSPGESRIELDVWLDLARAALLDSSNPRAWYHLGKCSQASRFDQAALNHYARAKACASAEKCPLDERHRQKLEDAIAQISASIKSALAKVGKEGRANAAEFLKSASNLFAAADKVRPASRTAAARKKADQDAAQKRTEARGKLDAAIKANPFSPDAHLLYAKLDVAAKKPDAALDHYRNAAKAAPTRISICREAAEYALKNSKPIQAEPFMYAALAHLSFDRRYPADLQAARETAELYARVLTALKSPDAPAMTAFAKELKAR